MYSKCILFAVVLWTNEHLISQDKKIVLVHFYSIENIFQFASQYHISTYFPTLVTLISKAGKVFNLNIGIRNFCVWRNLY